MTDTTTGIKPCPFCGGPGKSITVMGEWVGQGNGPDGGAYGPTRRRIVCAAIYETPSRACPQNATPDTEAEAIAAWNTRAFDFFGGPVPVDVNLGTDRMEPEGLHLDPKGYQVPPAEHSLIFTIVQDATRAQGGALYRVDCNGQRWMDGHLTYAEAVSRKEAAEAGRPIPRVGL